MKLKSPFFISARLAPAIRIANATLSFSDNQFILDFCDGSEHTITDFSFPTLRLRGDTNESVLQNGFGAILSFLSACAESRAHAERQGKDASEGENSDLFPENVGQWAQENSDEIDMMKLEIEERKNLICAD